MKAIIEPSGGLLLERFTEYEILGWRHQPLPSLGSSPNLLSPATNYQPIFDSQPAYDDLLARSNSFTEEGGE